MRILTVNAGSSTLKLSLLDPDDNVLARRNAEAALALDVYLHRLRAVEGLT